MRALLRTLLNLFLKKIISPPSFSTAMSASLTRGAWDHQGQYNVRLARGRKAYSPHKDPVTLIEVEVWVREENLTSIFPSQSNDVMVEHVEREALSEVFLQVRPKEVVSLSEEIPSVVKLDSLQLGEAVLLILRSESIVGGGCRKDDGRNDGTSKKLVVLAGGGGRGRRTRNGHEASREERMKRVWDKYILSVSSGTVVERGHQSLRSP